MDKPNLLQFDTEDTTILVLENDETVLHDAWHQAKTVHCTYVYLKNEHLQALLDGKAIFASDPAYGLNASSVVLMVDNEPATV